MKASELDPLVYHSFPEFAEYGIPLELVSAALITTLQHVRDKTGIPITPSPVHEGWARTSGSKTSRHYAVDRLSDAGDIFPARGRCLELWARLLETSNIGAVGLYSDTRGVDGAPWPMIHLDLRKTRQKVLWVRDGDYYYLPQNQIDFWRVVSKIAKMEGNA